MKPFLRSPIIVVLLIGILFSTTLAQYFTREENIFTAESIDLNIQIRTAALADESAQITDFKTEFSYFPQETYRQKVITLEDSPKGNIIGNAYIFKLKNPSPSDLEFTINAKLKTENKFIQINNTIPFPIEKYPVEVLKYLKSTSSIDSGNEDIIRITSSIIEGENDLYRVVNKVGIWVEENIEYSLDDITQEAVLPASWALKNRRGVCDELTNLFIAMLRSVGVPARFVSGIAYTNSEFFDDAWNPHGWAEVYFPEGGWVPFDITYGQFSYIDASHIKLSDSIDPDYMKTKFTWTGNNFNMNTIPLEFKTEVTKKYGKISPLTDLKVSIENDHINFGSYNRVNVQVQNKAPHYVTTRVMLGKVDIIEIEDKKYQTVILAPHEEKTISWIIRTNEDLNPELRYTLPVTAHTPFGALDSEELIIDITGNELTSQDVKETNNEELSENYSKKINFFCLPREKEFYEDETVEVLCKVKNEGTRFLENISVCLEDCQTLSVGIGREEKTIFPLKNNVLGQNMINATAIASDIQENSEIVFLIEEIPNITIQDMSSQKEIAFNKPFTVSVAVNKTSTSIPYNVHVRIKGKFFEKTFVREELLSDKIFTFTEEGRKLNKGENKINVTISYQDKKGRTYQKNEQEIIILEEVSFFEHIQIGARNRVHNWASAFT